MSKNSIWVFKPVNRVENEAEARDLAIDWQHWAQDHDLYMSEYADASTYFLELATVYPNLMDEFRENGII